MYCNSNGTSPVMQATIAYSYIHTFGAPIGGQGHNIMIDM